MPKQSKVRPALKHDAKECLLLLRELRLKLGEISNQQWLAGMRATLDQELADELALPIDKAALATIRDSEVGDALKPVNLGGGVGHSAETTVRPGTVE